MFESPRDIGVVPGCWLAALLNHWAAKEEPGCCWRAFRKELASTLEDREGVGGLLPPLLLEVGAGLKQSWSFAFMMFLYSFMRTFCIFNTIFWNTWGFLCEDNMTQYEDFPGPLPLLIWYDMRASASLIRNPKYARCTDAGYFGISREDQAVSTAELFWVIAHRRRLCTLPPTFVYPPSCLACRTRPWTWKYGAKALQNEERECSSSQTFVLPYHTIFAKGPSSSFHDRCFYLKRHFTLSTFLTRPSTIQVLFGLGLKVGCWKVFWKYSHYL